MNRFSKVFIGLSTVTVLATGAYAYCNGDAKSCDYKKDGYKYSGKHDSMCSMKKSKEHGKNSPKMIMKAIERLDLTPDQRAKIAEIKNKYHATMPNLSDAFTKNSLDEKKLNEVLNFDVKTIQIKIITQSYEVLNDIQRGYLKEMLDRKAQYKDGAYNHKSGDRKNCEMRK